MSKRQFGHFAKNIQKIYSCTPFVYFDTFLKTTTFSRSVFQGTLGVVESWRLAKKSRQSNLTKMDIGNDMGTL